MKTHYERESEDHALDEVEGKGIRAKSLSSLEGNQQIRSRSEKSRRIQPHYSEIERLIPAAAKWLPHVSGSPGQ